MTSDVYGKMSYVERAAPLRVRQHPASQLDSYPRYKSNNEPRKNHRGRRSFLAQMRRALPRRCRALPGTTSGEAEVSVPENSSEDPRACVFNARIASCDNAIINQRPPFPRHKSKEKILIFMINIRCLQAHQAELEFHLNELRPHIVLLQETWLDESTEAIRISGYTECSRRDRSTEPNRGGILSLQRSDFNHMVHICNSETEERSWHFVHLEPETILIGNWYRPGATVHDGFDVLRSEISDLASDCTSVILTGDLNIHHRSWLRFSNAETMQGADLKTFCDSFGLLQLVSTPTRQEYLLDLFLTDMPGVIVKVGSYIADHKSICAHIPIPEIKCQSITRYGFHLSRADWPALESALDAFDWQKLKRGTAEDALNHFMDVLWVHLCTHIPMNEFKMTKKSHPWLNDICERAIQEKNSAEGTESFEEKRSLCSQTLKAEYQRHLANLKSRIANLDKGSKQWWKLNRELLEKRSKLSNIPPLKDGSIWINDSAGKANLLAKTFCEKSELPAEAVDCPFFGFPDAEFDDFIALRTRSMLKLLKEIIATKATGPDRIPAIILKRLARYLALPFTLVCRRLFWEGCWPTAWKLHHICPLYKRHSAFLAGNYRGIHLTSILSKIAERFIGHQLMLFLQNGKFGPNQWAFTPGLSARDLVSALVLGWILCICHGKKVAGYLSDISSAFDRVCKEYLLAKLHAAGVGSNYLRFLDAYLQPRRGKVIVEGVASDVFEIADTVFQGTVLGPCLWNLFFADVARPAREEGGCESIFADDLSVFKEFERFECNEHILSDMRICRAKVHRWGRINRVSFDPSKEHLVIVHPRYGYGDPFKLLGCLIDNKLIMKQAIDKILSQIRPKIRAILRTRHHYDCKTLVNQFKTHVWGLMEFHNGGIFHAASYLLAKLDSAQRGFLNELELTPEIAFLEFNFAPPSLRRDIGILGLMHKRVLGLAHPVYQRLLPFFGDYFGYLRADGHSKQLYGHDLSIHYQHDLHKRSIFGMTRIYNSLPQNVVDHDNVKNFQSALTIMARTACQNNQECWWNLFSARS